MEKIYERQEDFRMKYGERENMEGKKDEYV